MVTRKNETGVSLIELMIAIAISGVIGIVFSQSQHFITRFTLVAKAKQEVVQESRTAITVMQKLIQQGSATTFVIDQSTGQPPYSRLYFQATDTNGVTKEFYFYQSSKNLYLDYRTVGASSWNQKLLTKNVKFLSFFYPRTDDNKLLSLTLTLSKQTAEQKETFLQLSLQKIRIYNS